MIDAIAHHWPEYLIEGVLLAAFMLTACAVCVLLEHPASPVRRRLRLAAARRVVGGVAMGLTAVAIIYSPWGRRSGAHLNPAVTITFAALGRVALRDAVLYCVSQILGGIAGVLVARAVLGKRVAHPAVRYAMTSPGRRGPGGAWLAEFVIAFILMGVVLGLGSAGSAAAYTGLAAGLLVCIFISIEAPYSGMSLNPARTLASAVFAGEFRHLWVYFTAPVAAMAAAAGLFVAARGADAVVCAKLCHGDGPCVFRCRVGVNPAARAGIEGRTGSRP